MKNYTHKLSISVGLLMSSLFLINSTNLNAEGLDKKIKHGIDNVADHLKKDVDKVKGDYEDVQKHFDKYKWKGVIENHVTSGVATLSHLKLNSHSKAVVVRPADKVECEVQSFLDPEKCSAISFYRVVIGLKGIGPQTTICNYLGAVAGDSFEKFTLTAPLEPGVYEVRFRVVESFTETEARNGWTVEGNEPDSTTTIGVIIVK